MFCLFVDGSFRKIAKTGITHKSSNLKILDRVVNVLVLVKFKRLHSFRVNLS